MRLARAVVVLVIVSAWSVPAWGQAKTDVVTLLNGDRITGEIVALDRGRLEFKTDDAGTIYFEWTKLATVTSTNLFDIGTASGGRLLGRLRSPNAGTVLITGIGDVISLPMSEVTRLEPIGVSFWTKLEGSVNAGFSYTRSSGIAQTNLNSDLEYRQPEFAFRLAAAATVTYRTDEENRRDDQGAINVSFVRYRGARWAFSGVGRVETNESLGLVLRTQGGGLVGQRLVNSNRAQFEFGGGIMANEEQGIDTSPTQNLEGVFAVKSSYYTYDRPKTNLDATLQYYPSLSHWGRQRLQVDVGGQARVVQGFPRRLQPVRQLRQRPAQPFRRSQRHRRLGIGRLVVRAVTAAAGLGSWFSAPGSCPAPRRREPLRPADQPVSELSHQGFESPSPPVAIERGLPRASPTPSRAKAPVQKLDFPHPPWSHARWRPVLRSDAAAWTAGSESIRERIGESCVWRAVSVPLKFPSCSRPVAGAELEGIELDLADLISVDQAGVEALRRIQDGGAALVRAAGYIQMKLDSPSQGATEASRGAGTDSRK